MESIETKQVVDALRVVFPHGHPEFLPTTVREIELHSQKNHDYASGGDPLGNFNRVASIMAFYPGLSLSDRRVVAALYAFKQIDAVLWGIANNVAHKVEGLNERLQDISVYSKIIMCMNTEDANARAQETEKQKLTNDRSREERRKQLHASIDRQFGADLQPKNEYLTAADMAAPKRQIAPEYRSPVALTNGQPHKVSECGALGCGTGATPGGRMIP